MGTTTQNAWYTDAFGPRYFAAHNRLISEEATRREIDKLEELLRMDRPRRVLDVACGMGRHAIELAARGHRVTGLDINPDLLSHAKVCAERRRTDISWILDDMRNSHEAGQFDVVINMSVSFGYLGSKNEDLAALRSMRKALNAEGILLLEVPNRDFTLSHPRSYFTRTPDETCIGETAHFNITENILEIHSTIFDATGRYDTRFRLALYTLAELIGMIDEAGLKLTYALSDLDHDIAATLESPRFYLVLRAKDATGPSGSISRSRGVCDG